MKLKKTLFVLLVFQPDMRGELFTYYSETMEEASGKAIDIAGERKIYSLRNFPGGFRFGQSSLPGELWVEMSPVLPPTTRQTDPSLPSTT